MKITLDINDAVMAELEQRGRASRPHRVGNGRDSVAPAAPFATKAGDNSRPAEV